MYHRGRRKAAWFLASLLATAAPSLARQTSPPDQNTAAAQAPAPAQAPAAPPAQGPIDASGWVKTADGSPVPGATLRLTNTDTKQAWVSWTDESGKFEFPTLPPGHYTIEATQLGFVPSSLDVQLSPPPQPPPFNWSLRVATLAQLTAPPNRLRPEAAARRPRLGGAAQATARIRSEWRTRERPPGGPGGRAAETAVGDEGSFLRAAERGAARAWRAAASSRPM